MPQPLTSQTGSAGDVGEFEIRVLMVERDHGIAALAIAIDGRSVHRDDVELAVVVAVDQAGAAAHGFDDVFLFRSGDMGDGQARFLGHILECWHRRLKRGRFSGSTCLGRRKQRKKKAQKEG